MRAFCFFFAPNFVAPIFSDEREDEEEEEEDAERKMRFKTLFGGRASTGGSSRWGEEGEAGDTGLFPEKSKLKSELPPPLFFPPEESGGQLIRVFGILKERERREVRRGRYEEKQKWKDSIRNGRTQTLGSRK